MDSSCSSSRFFEVNLTYQGKSNIVEVSGATTGFELHQKTLNIVFGIAGDSDGDNTASAPGTTATELLKLLFKGKRITAQPNTLPFEDIAPATKKKPLKIMVMATNISAIQELSTKRSDPTIRGFDQEKDALARRRAATSQKYWADAMVQDKDYKFCRMTACTDHSFGHRSTESTPHAFHAIELLEKLATDPGIVAIMKERELVVGTLGEMDPIDDRIMQKTESHGGCLLGYNTNRGLRIDIKLRTDDLSGFRPYPELVGTLIHELSHNWVGDHNALFWTNYAQMRAEYFYTHARLRKSSVIVRGKKTSELAGLNEQALENVFELIMNELVKEMAQHGLHPSMIAAPIRQRIQELEEEAQKTASQQGHRLGGKPANGFVNNTSTMVHKVANAGSSARELAWVAAERRAREQKEQKKKNHSR
mmetsp:Transcript_21655/g.48677  ORF Transcript_21655/g.48677 Transcript_21655/m.48677 type:complete len:421 (-) Transcript_21655:622-1884(-)|eukprot:CAMPEP_0201136660 /NCGR_PEP_ID=MMETSP0850-20130426/54989_1 /ASSEMBLY_ACC=CAM_ASM_000622 /TAXON_ID=183588 /ORGANISM="Pseudo-nitzschia fraudulenta, Strain WWA7" /LENGTH=420 /DNA_ID=CAMNT_0047407975 /DNA_START=26 /DNA_END=1288 /DNA_ORIENTATION=-